MSRILVVDDSTTDRVLVGGLLQRSLACTVEFAANGLEAMARMRDIVPDLIVTDLNMGEMDGLQLVRAVRRDYPQVPIILMTAYGSESLALDALEQGAASYVPKSQLPVRLAKTALEVLDMAWADRSSAQLLLCLDRVQFEFTLHNEPRLIDPLVDLIQQMITGMEFSDLTGRLQIGVAVKEALRNAILHGNLEVLADAAGSEETGLLGEHDESLVDRRRTQAPYCDRKVFVHVMVSRDEARIVVRDQGAGFDVASLPDHRELGALDQGRGRGLALMRTLMDEVTFNDTGNEVTLVRRRRAPAASAAGHA